MLALLGVGVGHPGTSVNGTSLLERITSGLDRRPWAKAPVSAFAPQKQTAHKFKAESEKQR